MSRQTRDEVDIKTSSSQGADSLSDLAHRVTLVISFCRKTICYIPLRGKSIITWHKKTEMSIHHIERAIPPAWFLSPSKRRNPPQILGSSTHLDTLTYTTWRRGERELSCIIGCGRRRSILCVLCSTGWLAGGLGEMVVVSCIIHHAPSHWHPIPSHPHLTRAPGAKWNNATVALFETNLLHRTEPMCCQTLIDCVSKPVPTASCRV